MKKVFALFLAAMLMLSLTACGDDASTKKRTVEQPPAFKEAVLIDNDQYAIIITGIHPNAPDGYTLDAELENKTADHPYTFALHHAAINGVQCCPENFCPVISAPGKSKEKIVFPDSALRENDILKYTDIALTFCVYVRDDPESENAAEETVHLYPYGEESAAVYVREAVASDEVILDNEHTRVTVTGYEETKDTFFAKLYFENKTNEALQFHMDCLSANGKMFDAPFYYGNHVNLAGKECAFARVVYLKNDLKESGITEVTEMSFYLSARKTDDDTAFANEFMILHP